MKNVLSRRQFLNVAGKYGMRAALATSIFAGTNGFLPGTGFMASKASAAGKYKIRFGAGIISPSSELHMQTALYEFVRIAEEKSGGEIEFQVIDSGQSCGEASCGDRVMSGVIDMGNASPQNLGTVMPYSVAMDFPFLYKDRTSYLNFLYSPDSNAIYRDVLRNTYDIEPLWGAGEMRDVFLGKKYSDKPAITSMADFANAKIRITNSIMIANTMKTMGANAIPLAWSETLEGLNSGVVDGAETWAGAASGYGMASVLAHSVPLQFCVGYELFFMSRKTFTGLPTNMQEVILEAAYETMQIAFDGVLMAQNKYVGNGPNPEATSNFSKEGVKIASLTDAQLEEFKDAADVNKNADLWAPVHKRFDAVSGVDTYGQLSELAAKYNKTTKHEPQRWWV